MRSGRPTKDTRHYWTKDHRFLLYGLALKALTSDPCPTVDKDELVSIGWLHCMRRCRKKELPNAIGNTLRVMKAYIRSEKYRRKFDKLIDEVRYDMDAPQDVAVVLENLQGRDLELANMILQGYTQYQIAQVWGISREAVRQRLNRIKKRFNDVRCPL